MNLYLILAVLAVAVALLAHFYGARIVSFLVSVETGLDADDQVDEVEPEVVTERTASEVRHRLDAEMRRRGAYRRRGVSGGPR